MPESVVGQVAGAEFESWGVALDQTFRSHTYLGVQAELLKSRGDRRVGAIDVADTLPPGFAASGTRQELDYTEKSLLATVNQLLGDEWSLGASYRVSQARLRQYWPELAAAAGGAARSDVDALLHQATLFCLFNHRSGFFARAEAVWHAQSNGGYSPALPGDDFWQFNAFAGYRLPHRRAEITVGVLNLSGRDYRLNPLNLHAELARERTFVAGLKFFF